MGSALAEEPIVQGIHILNLHRTDARVVLRELPFQKGSRWKPEYITIGERRLRNLGIFSSAFIYPPDNDGMVYIYVKERWTFWVLPETSRGDTGKSTAGFSLTEYNAWGLNHYFRLGFREDTGRNFSELNGASYQTSYVWRRIGDSKFSWRLDASRGRSIFDAYENGVLKSQYLLERNEISTLLSYALGPVPGEGWGIGIGFSSALNNFTLQRGPNVPSVKDSRRKGMQAFINYLLVDDRITWLTGFDFSYVLDIAHRGFGSTINVYRQVVSFNAHVPLSAFREGATFDTRIAAGWATGEVLEDGLFDVGNKNQLRGYYPGELQGTYYVYGTLEGRFPLSVGGNLHLVSFIDLGQIWKNAKPAFGRKIVIGSGCGLRWTWRWLAHGTLRADIAYGWASHRWRAHIGTGQAF